MVVGGAAAGSNAALKAVAMFVSVPLASAATSTASCNWVVAPPLSVLVKAQVTTSPSSDAQTQSSLSTCEKVRPAGRTSCTPSVGAAATVPELTTSSVKSAC